MIDLSAVSTVVATVSVVVGVVFTILEIRHLAKTRRTDVIMRIYERCSSRELIEAINKVARGSANFATVDDFREEGWVCRRDTACCSF